MSKKVPAGTPLSEMTWRRIAIIALFTLVIYLAALGLIVAVAIFVDRSIR